MQNSNEQSDTTKKLNKSLTKSGVLKGASRIPFLRRFFGIETYMLLDDSFKGTKYDSGAKLGISALQWAPIFGPWAEFFYFQNRINKVIDDLIDDENLPYENSKHIHDLIQLKNTLLASTLYESLGQGMIIAGIALSCTGFGLAIAIPFIAVGAIFLGLSRLLKNHMETDIYKPNKVRESVQLETTRIGFLGLINANRSLLRDTSKQQNAYRDGHKNKSTIIIDGDSDIEMQQHLY